MEAGDQGMLTGIDEGTGAFGDWVPLFEDKRLLGGEVPAVEVLPFKTMSRIRVSMGVLPTSLRKKTCSMTCEDTVLNEGRRRSSLPNRVGWLGYCVLQYSSRAHWDFSCSCSMACALVSPGASKKGKSIMIKIKKLSLGKYWITC